MNRGREAVASARIVFAAITILLVISANSVLADYTPAVNTPVFPGDGSMEFLWNNARGGTTGYWLGACDRNGGGGQLPSADASLFGGFNGGTYQSAGTAGAINLNGSGNSNRSTAQSLCINPMRVLVGLWYYYPWAPGNQYGTPYDWGDTSHPADGYIWVDMSGTYPSVSPIGYSLPLNPTDFSTTTSLFDHDATSSQMTRYDGTVFYGNDAILGIGIGNCTDGAGCYDGHHGIDFGTYAEGKNILAAASGTVATLGWENPSDHGQGYGYYMRLYHPQLDQSTIYAHATTTASFFSVNDPVNSGDTLLLSGATGYTSGPSGQHLHFGVIDGDTADPNDAMDPFGWFGTSTDPRTNDKGYLWETNPPSL